MFTPRLPSTWSIPIPSRLNSHFEIRDGGTIRKLMDGRHRIVPPSRISQHNGPMSRLSSRKQCKEVQALRCERLDRLRFVDALNDTIALSELAMDMVESFSSRHELIWIQNGFKPARKGRRAKRQRSHRHS